MMDKPLLQDGKQWVLMTTKTAIDHDVEQNGSERDQEGKDRIKDDDKISQIDVTQLTIGRNDDWLIDSECMDCIALTKWRNAIGLGWTLGLTQIDTYGMKFWKWASNTL